MKVILIAGKAGSGKNEVAKIVKEYYTYQMKKCACTQFSKYIKSLAMDIFEWDGNEVTKPRGELQRLGDVARDLNPEFFTSRMIEDILVYEKMGIDVVIISDVRMPEEIEEIKENFDDSYSVLVINQFAQSKLTVEEQSHKTETALEEYNEFDKILVNDDLNALRDKVFKFLDEVK